MSASHEAFVSVVDPEGAINAARDYDVRIFKDASEPRSIQVVGDYESIMRFMTEYLSMSSAEADTMIGDFVGNEENFAVEREPYDALDYYEEDVMAADYSAVAAEDEEDLQSARTTGSGRPFEGKMSLKGLLEAPYSDDVLRRAKETGREPWSLQTNLEPTQEEVFDAFEELIGSGSEMDAASAADFLAQETGMDREKVFAILKADEDDFRHSLGEQTNPDKSTRPRKFVARDGQVRTVAPGYYVRQQGNVVQVIRPDGSAEDRVYFGEVMNEVSPKIPYGSRDENEGGAWGSDVRDVEPDYPPWMDDQPGASEGGPPCDHCGSENTTMQEPIPSMVGYGHDESWTCNDCGKTSFTTELGESRLFETTETVEVGDLVDVDAEESAWAGVRVLELVDDVNDRAGPPDPRNPTSFTGPGFVGQLPDEEGELVFSFNQVVPGSKDKYGVMSDEDPYFDNYATHSDYFDADGGHASLPWRGGARVEGKQAMTNESTSRHNVANDYAYRQVQGSLKRRGAEVTVSPDGLTVTGHFSDPNDAHVAWLALGEKYPNSGPNAVHTIQSGRTLEFRFEALKESIRNQRNESKQMNEAESPWDAALAKALHNVTIDGADDYEELVARDEVVHWMHGNQILDIRNEKDRQGARQFSQKLGELMGDRELSPEAQEFLYQEFPEAMSALEMGLGESSFDRFMDRIVIQESHAANRKLNVVDDSPQRARAQRYQDRPANKTRWGK